MFTRRQKKSYLLSVILLSKSAILDLTRINSSRMRTTRSSSHHGGGSPHPLWEQTPQSRCPHPPGAAPPEQTPLGVGLETPWPDPPQLPPWLWAWRPPGQIPLNFPLGCGPGNLQGMLGYHIPPPP